MIMVRNLPEKISYELVLPQYEKLLMLKKALTLDESEEVSEKILLERAREHNEREIYLIGYLVDMVTKAPKELQEQFDLLISCYDNPKEYAKIYRQTENMFRTNPKFRRYEAQICAHLDLFAPFNCTIANLTIYGICPEHISTTVQLQPRNIVMNLHILQKWLSEQRKVTLSQMSIIEQKVVLYLANGYTPKDILDEDDGIIEGEEVEKLKSVLYEMLPARCNVQSVCQVMAVMYMSNPDLSDICKAMQMLENFEENEEF